MLILTGESKMKIVAFAASSSQTSINKKLVSYAANQLTRLAPELSAELLDLNDFELPLFSVDKEKILGHPQLAKTFLEKLRSADGVMISFAEHNGSYTAAYKNLFDWVSRIDPKVYAELPMVLLSTSPGKGGAKNVLASAASSLPHFGATLQGSLSVPEFSKNFDTESNQLTNQEINQELTELLEKLVTSLTTD